MRVVFLLPAIIILLIVIISIESLIGANSDVALLVASVKFVPLDRSCKKKETHKNFNKGEGIYA